MRFKDSIIAPLASSDTPTRATAWRVIRALLQTSSMALAVSLPAHGQGGTLQSITTQFASNNGQAGNMFDLKATRDVRVIALDGNLDTGAQTVEVYIISGGFQGQENNPGAWTLVGSGPVTGNGTDVVTPLPFALDIEVSAG
jgi:hypothetical protein